MIRWSVNIGTLYPNLPVRDRFAAVACSGFNFAEMWCPFPDEASIAQALLVSGVHLVGFLYEPGGTHNSGAMPVGERGILNGTVSLEDCLHFFRRSVAFARATSAEHVAVLLGNVVDDRERQLAWAADALRRACEITEPAGLRIVVEPLNSLDTPSYMLHDAEEAVEFVRTLGRPGVRLLLDVYHVAREGADPVQLIPRAQDVIGHVQIADCPGRGAPGTGQMDMFGVVQALKEVGYDGFIGVEYLPGDRTTEESLSWLPAELRSVPVEADIFRRLSA
jgi:hydroxypyruvate isomerase